MCFGTGKIWPTRPEYMKFGALHAKAVIPRTSRPRTQSGRTCRLCFQRLFRCGTGLALSVRFRYHLLSHIFCVRTHERFRYHLLVTFFCVDACTRTFCVAYLAPRGRLRECAYDRVALVDVVDAIRRLESVRDALRVAGDLLEGGRYRQVEVGTIKVPEREDENDGWYP